MEPEAVVACAGVGGGWCSARVRAPPATASCAGGGGGGDTQPPGGPPAGHPPCPPHRRHGLHQLLCQANPRKAGWRIAGKLNNNRKVSRSFC